MSIVVENVDVWGFEHAIRGMRNPMNSWDKGDSGIGCKEDRCINCKFDPNWCGMTPEYVVGEADLKLMQKLYKAGPEHRKYLRQIFVSMDITAPLFWWKEANTYKVGTTSDSCSTMHKITAKEFDINDFSHDTLEELKGDEYNTAWQNWINLIQELNYYRNKYNETKNKLYWRQIIEKLPSSYNQKRTYTMSYENVVNMIHQRKGHKLDEWNIFVYDTLEKLPYISEIMGEDENAE